MDNRLRFYARNYVTPDGTEKNPYVTDPHAQERGIRRFVGRRWQEVLPGRWTWCPTGEPQAIAPHPDLIDAAKKGDLWPADEATAKACGLPFNPAFDAETTETIKAFKEKRLAAESAAKKAAGDVPPTTQGAPETPKKPGKSGG